MFKNLVLSLFICLIFLYPQHINAQRRKATPTPRVPRHKITPTNSPTPSPITSIKTGDTNNDGKINTIDLSYLLSRWGTPDSTCDFSRDGKINTIDLSILLSNYGK